MAKKKKNRKNKNVFLNITITIIIFTVVIMLVSLVFRVFYANEEFKNEPLLIEQEINHSIQVSVLNATEVNGLASRIRDYLRAKNFDVVEIGNYDKASHHSFIIDRVGDSTAAKQFARIVGLPDSMIIVKIDSSYFLKASLIVGNDYKNLRMFRNSY